MTSETSAVARKASNGVRTALGLSGLVALIVGILFITFPGKSAQTIGIAFAVIAAIYMILVGLVYLGLGIFSRSVGGWSRVGHILLGLVFIAAGVILFVDLAVAGSMAVMLFGIIVGVIWIIEGVVAFTTLSTTPSKGWTVFFGVLSLIAGIILLFSPLWGAVVLLWITGISLVVLGVLQIVRAFTFTVAGH